MEPPKFIMFIEDVVIGVLALLAAKVLRDWDKNEEEEDEQRDESDL